MALSGSFYKTIASGYRLLIEWSATQDEVNNKSTITAKLYWQSTSSAYYINSSSTRTGTLSINGNTSTDTGLTARLSGNQKKLLMTKVYDVTHNSDGTKSTTIAGSFNLSGVSLSGTDYGTQSISDTVDLNKIARKSTVTSSLNFTAPNAFPVSINRASSSFTHTVKVSINGTLVKTVTGVGTGVTIGWSESEMTQIFTLLAQASSKPLSIELITYSGGTNIGSNTYTGTCFAEDPSSNVNSASFNIGDKVTVSVARNNSNFKHKVKFIVGGTTIHTSPDFFDYTYDWTPTDAEKTAMYNKTPNSSTVSSQIQLITYYNGVQVDQPTNKDGTAKVVNSDPTFAGAFTYKDVNSVTVAITANDQQIVQGKSSVTATLPSTAKATAKNGATISKYTATLNGVSKTVNETTGDLTFVFGTIDSSANATLSIAAIDSRGFKTTVSKTVTVIPYKVPSMSASAKRDNGFDSNTVVALNGSFSDISGKNAIIKAEYRYKENISGAVYPSAYTTFILGGTSPNYTTTAQNVTLDRDKAFVFEFRVTDKLGSSTTERTVNKGRPIMFVDKVKNSVGIGMFPTSSDSLYVKGNLRAVNPNNETAEAYLGFLNDQARIRVGGTGAGAVKGFQVHGTGDKVLLSLNNSDSLKLESGVLKINDSNIYDYEIPRTAPSFKNSWESYFDCAYWKTKEGIVYFQGMIRNGADGTVAFTLPAGCRPTSDQLYYVHTRNGGAHRIDISASTGDVTVNTEGAAFNLWYDLNGMFFTTK
jgi:hypothetical protein